MQIKLNGYPTANPYGQSASEIELALYLSLVGEDVVTRFREVLKAAYHSDKVEFHSSAFTFFSVLNSLPGASDSFLLIDIGGEITEISLAWKGLLTETVSFPKGRNYVIRHLVEGFGTTAPEAYSSLKLHLTGKHHKFIAGKITEVLIKAKTEWLTIFREALDKILEHHFLPEDIFAVGDPYILPLFRNWLGEEQFENFTIGNKHFTVNRLQEDLLSSFCDHLSGVGLDLSLMAEAIFCDKILPS